MKGQLGTQAALTATAHKLARIVYLALKHGMMYARQSQEDYEAQMREKQIKALRRKARQLGLEVIEKTSGSVATAVAAAEQEWTSKRGDQNRFLKAAGAYQGRTKTHTHSERSVALVAERVPREEPGTEMTSVY
jgi:hypothetical protein